MNLARMARKSGPDLWRKARLGCAKNLARMARSGCVKKKNLVFDFLINCFLKNITKVDFGCREVSGHPFGSLLIRKVI